MELQILKVVISEQIALVTISRPEALNALNTRFFNEMDQVVAEINAKPDVRVMIITGEGKAFVAGADIAEMVDKTQEEGSDFSRLGQNTFGSLEKMETMGLDKLTLEAEREIQFLNIYRSHDAARQLSDEGFERVREFTQRAFEMALHFVAEQENIGLEDDEEETEDTDN